METMQILDQNQNLRNWIGIAIAPHWSTDWQLWVTLAGLYIQYVQLIVKYTYCICLRSQKVLEAKLIVLVELSLGWSFYNRYFDLGISRGVIN